MYQLYKMSNTYLMVSTTPLLILWAEFTLRLFNIIKSLIMKQLGHSFLQKFHIILNIRSFYKLNYISNLQIKRVYMKMYFIV